MGNSHLGVGLVNFSQRLLNFKAHDSLYRGKIYINAVQQEDKIVNINHEHAEYFKWTCPTSILGLSIINFGYINLNI
jgi:hypothetical protein